MDRSWDGSGYAGGVWPSARGADVCSPFDPAPLQDLAQLLSVEQIRDLADSYHATVCALLAQIEGRVTAADWPDVKELAHDLKGTAGNFGASALQKLAAELEIACAVPLQSDITAIFMDMQRASAEAWSAIQAYLEVIVQV